MDEIVSQIENFNYIDNPLVINKYKKQDNIAGSCKRLRQTLCHVKEPKLKKQFSGSQQVLKDGREAVDQSMLPKAKDQMKLLKLISKITGIDLTQYPQPTYEVEPQMQYSQMPPT